MFGFHFLWVGWLLRARLKLMHAPSTYRILDAEAQYCHEGQRDMIGLFASVLAVYWISTAQRRMM